MDSPRLVALAYIVTVFLWNWSRYVHTVFNISVPSIALNNLVYKLKIAIIYMNKFIWNILGKRNPAQNVRGFFFYIMQRPHTARRASLLRPLLLLFYTLQCSFYFLQWCWFCNIAVHACIFSKGIYRHIYVKQIFIFLLCPSAFLWPAQLRQSWSRCAFFRRFFLRLWPDNPSLPAGYHRPGTASAKWSRCGHARYYSGVSAKYPV